MVPIHGLTVMISMFMSRQVLCNEDFSATNGLGLLLKEKNVSIHRNSDHNRIGVRILGVTDLAAIAAELEEIGEIFADLTNLQILKNNESKIATTINVIITQINYFFGDQKKTTFVHSRLIGTEPAVDKEKYNCTLEFPKISKDNFIAIKNEIQVLLNNIDLTTLKLDAKSTQLKEFLSILYHILDIAADNRHQLYDRELIVESLENGEIPNNLLVQLSLVKCIEAGALQKEYLNFCKRDTKGLVCEIDVATFRSAELYTILTPISYHNVRLVAETKNKIFAIDHSGHIGLLDCGEINNVLFNPDDEFYKSDVYCTFKTYDNPCMTAIKDDDQSKIITKCNFTSETPELVTRTLEGILIMNHDKNVVIREYGNVKSQKLTITNKAPVLIKTMYPLSVHSNELELTINPLKDITERKITYTRYSDDFIDKIVKEAAKHDFLEDVDISDYILLVLAAIVTFIFPITCGMCLYCIKSSELYQRFKESRASKAIQEINEERKNFLQNKKIIKGVKNLRSKSQSN
jgi:hypothetical protein